MVLVHAHAVIESIEYDKTQDLRFTEGPEFIFVTDNFKAVENRHFLQLYFTKPPEFLRADNFAL